MTNDNSKHATRRGFLSALSAASIATVGATGLVAANPDEDAVTCSGPSVDCGGETDYPITMSQVDDPMKTYNGMDYKAAVGLHGRYYGSYTNTNIDGSVWLHDFIISGFSSARSRDQYAGDWNRDPAISEQTAVIENNKPDEGAIVSTVGSQQEWVGESRHNDDVDNDDNYVDAMKVAVETLAGEVESKVGWALAAQDFVEALSNDSSDDPGEADEWTPSWSYGGPFGGYATDCSNTIRFAITSPEVGDIIDVTTKQEADIPTVNESDEIPYSSLGWYMETDEDGGGLSKSSVIESHPSATIERKENLPPYKEVQDMFANGSIKKVMLPIRAEASTSDL